jgi:hypothetical protein
VQTTVANDLKYDSTLQHDKQKQQQQTKKKKKKKEKNNKHNDDRERFAALMISKW